MERKVFRSRISVIMMLFIIAAVGVPFYCLVTVGGKTPDAGIYILAGTLVFVILVMTGMSYHITETQLIIKMCGIKYMAISIAVIVSVERSYNPLSSPAASLKRLCIRFEKGYRWPYGLVSPVREQEFLDALKKVNPDIYIRVNDKKA